MKMKRNISICLFAAFLVLIGGILISMENPKEQEEENSGIEMTLETETEEEALLSSATQPDYKYIIFSEDGRLVVYYSDNTTIFFNSGILEETLPEETKSQLPAGIRFQTDEELYDFLESYSS